MSWRAIGENKRCDGKPNGRRCKTILIVGAWFWLEGKKAYCATCATSPHVFDEMPRAELTKRRTLYLHITRRPCPTADSSA